MSELPNQNFATIGPDEGIDIHEVFHDILKSPTGNTSRSIAMQLISRSDDGPLENASIQLANLDKLNKFVPTSSSKDVTDDDITVR